MDTFRESAIGQLITLISPNLLYRHAKNRSPDEEASADSQRPPLENPVPQRPPLETSESPRPPHETPESLTSSTETQETKDPLIPMNWSGGKKLFVLAQVSYLTTSVYIGSAIYTPGTMQISEEFGFSPVIVTLGLTLYVVGYALGPALWTIFSEDPKVGRSVVFVGTLCIFVILQIAAALVPNLGGLLAIRFLSGFFGSPALSIPGSMLFEIFSPQTRLLALATWAAGPTCGPLLAGFAVQNKSWRWSFWILLMMNTLCLAIISVALPESLEANIQYRQKKLWRQLGEKRGSNEQDIEGAKSYSRGAAFNKAGKLIAKILFTEPIAMLLNLYIALIYGLLYLWFESFPIVFGEIYGFSIGIEGLAYIGILVGVLLSLAGFSIYVKYYVNPRMNEQGYLLPVERRLVPAFITSFAIPICLFMFGWTSRPDILWIVPVIATGFFAIGIFLAFQSVITYLVESYQENAPGALAANTLFRSAFGAAFPIFGTGMYHKLGVGWASSLIGFISVGMMPIPFFLYYKGQYLRHRSSYAHGDVSS